MSIDKRIREGLGSTNGALPEPDVLRALSEVTARAGARDRRRLVIGIAAIAAAAVVLFTVVVPHHGVDKTAPPVAPKPTRLALTDENALFVAADAGAGESLTSRVEFPRVETRPSAMDIYLVSSGMPVRRVVATPAHERCPVVSPDHKRLAYFSDATIVVVALDPAGSPGGQQLEVDLGAEGERAYRPTLNIGPACPRWSPDGLSLAYRAGTARGLHVVTLGGQRRELGPGPGGPPVDLPWAADFAWSPDGSEVAYSSGEGVWRVSSGGGEPKRVWWGAGRPIAVSWSARDELAITVRTVVSATDGEREVDTVQVLDLGSGLSEPLAEIRADDAGAVWSPDGAELAFIGQDGHIHLTDRSRGTTSTLTPRVDGRRFDCWDVAWSRDGAKLLALLRAEEGLALALIPVDGSPAEVLTPWTWGFDWINLEDVSWAAT